MSKQVSLRDTVPPPTGTTLRWWIEDRDTYNEAVRLVTTMAQAMQWDDHDDYQEALEQLTRLPGFPKLTPGDKIEVGYMPRVSVAIPTRVH